MARWKVKPHPQVEAALLQEEEEVAKLLPDDPEAFAIHPRRIAYLALNRQITKRLASFPKLISYRDKGCGDEVRFRDIYGWRLIIKIDRDQKIVHVLYLSDIHDRHMSPRETFHEWKKTILSG